MTLDHLSVTMRPPSGTIGGMDTANESQSEAGRRLAALILDGMTSGDGSDLDDAYFCGMLDRIADAESRSRPVPLPHHDAEVKPLA